MSADSKPKTPREAKTVSDTSNSHNQYAALSEMADRNIRKCSGDFVGVEGKQLYGFDTPKKRNAMAEKAFNTPKTSLSSFVTPRIVRNRIRSDILKRTLESNEDEISTDESDSGLTPQKCPSEFVLKQSGALGTDYSDDSADWKESQESSAGSTSESDESLPEHFEVLHRSSLRANAATVHRRTSNVNMNDFIPKSDKYFIIHSSKKVLTSEHTLSRLKTSRLGHSNILSLLTSIKLPGQHEKNICSLFEEYKIDFNQWLRVLDDGFNILVYGLGSKRQLLQTFHREMLHEQPVIIVNGFFPSCTVKDVLDGIVHEILDLTSSNANFHEIVDFIEKEFKKMRQIHLFLIVHNIDGLLLRTNKAQEVMSRIASIPNIHLITSIDHLNAPLLWDNLKLSKFNFSCWDVTTMLPYCDETSFENSLLAQNSTDLALSSMNNVFQSLTINARKIYMVIANQQLKHKNDSNYQGIPFNDLYWLSRESFLVSSDLALRAQLTEFLDHKLIKAKRTTDGAEHLKIPVAVNLLQQFVELNK